MATVTRPPEGRIKVKVALKCRWPYCTEAAECERGYCDPHHRGACRGADAHG